VEASAAEMRKNKRITLRVHTLEKVISRIPPIKGPPILLKFKDIMNA
jgi:hypothetical protein